MHWKAIIPSILSLIHILNKSELIEAMANTASLSKKDAEAALNAYTDEMCIRDRASGFCEADESFLTGESDAISKNGNDMLLAGSFIAVSYTHLLPTSKPR